MAIYKFLSVVVLGLLSGCAGNSVQNSESSAAVVKEGAETNKPQESASKEAALKPPVQAASKQPGSTAIDPKVMYLLLTAELAGQRNQYDVALEGYMQAAKRVNDPRIAERAAKIAVFLNDRQKSESAVDLWLRQDASNLDAQMLAALTALRAERKQAALGHLEVLLQRDPAGFDDTLLELVKSLGSPQRTGFLSLVLNELAAKHVDQPAVYFVQALLAMQEKDNKLASAKLARALELRPAWDKALLAQAQLATLNNDWAGAEKILRDAIKQKPDDLKLSRMLAQILIKASKFELAIVEYQAILKAHPDDGESMFSLALLHLQLQQDGQARPYLEKLSHRPEWAGQAGYYLGKLAAKDGLMEKALVWFDSVNEGAFVFDAKLSSVAILLEQRDFEEALGRLDKMQRDFPNENVRLLVMRAEIYNDQKQYGKAYKMLSEALAKTPKQKELLYTRSLVAEHMGNMKAMEADLQAILKDHPDDVTALNALGYTLVNKTQRLQEAARYLRKAIKLQPDVPVIIDSYGWLLFKQGRYAEARDMLQRAYDKLPQTEIAGHLVEVLHKLKLESEAKALLDKALSKEPLDAYLLDIKKRLFAH